jgi:hypothetical protein
VPRRRLLRGDSAASALGRALAVAAPSGPAAEAAALVAAVWHWLDGDADAAWRALPALESGMHA